MANRIERLVDCLLCAPVDTWRHVAVVLPTERLGTWLVRLLSDHVAAFQPPKIMTLENFVSLTSLSLEVQTFEGDLVPDAAAQFILLSLLKDLRPPTLDSGMAHELLALFDTLLWCEPEPFGLLGKAIGEDALRGAPALASLEARVADLQRIHHAFWSHLGAHGLRRSGEPRLTWLRAFERRMTQVSESADVDERFPSFAWEKLLFLGFSDHTPFARRFRQALQGARGVYFWDSPNDTNGDPWRHAAENEESTPTEPRGMRAARPESAIRPQARRDRGDDPEFTSVNEESAPIEQRGMRANCGFRVEVRVADTPLGESAAAWQVVQDALAAGVAPSRIAILVPDEATYGPALRHACPDEVKSINWAIASPLRRRAHGHLLARLMAWHIGPSVTTLIDILTVPTIRAFVELRAGRKLYVALVGRLIQLPLATSQATLIGYLQEVSDDVDGALDDLLADLAGGFAAKEISAWRLHLEKWLKYYGPIPGSEDALNVVARSFFTGIGTTTGGTRYGAQEFWAVARRSLLDASMHEAGEHTSGVQVVKLSEGRMLPVEVAVVVGCHEGTFPKAIPTDRVLDPYLRAKLPIPGPREFAKLEEETFRNFLGEFPRLFLTTAREDFGGAAFRCSRFVEMVATAGSKVRRAASETWLTLWPSTSRQNKALEEPEVPGHFPAGERVELLSRFSASSLRRLIHCPYSYLMGELGLEPLWHDPDGRERREDGIALHGLCSSLISGTWSGREILPPLATELSGLTDGDERTHAIVQRFSVLTGYLSEPVQRRWGLHLHSFSGPRLAAFLSHLYTVQPAVSMGREVAFADDTALVLEERPLGMHGRMDWWDVFEGWQLIVDIKTRGGPDIRDVQTGVEPQLVLYALALGRGNVPEESHGVVCGYWDLMRGKFTTCVGQGPLPEGVPFALGRNASLRASVDRLTAAWKARLQSLLDLGEPFAPDRAHCGGCDHADICRRDDPRIGALLQPWEDRLKLAEIRAS